MEAGVDASNQARPLLQLCNAYLALRAGHPYARNLGTSRAPCLPDSC
jgi:hypothetical protein